MIVLRLAILAYIVAVVVTIIGSWIPMDPGSPPARVWDFARRITEPVLAPVRRVVPPVAGAVDLSPTIVLVVLFVLLRVVS